MGILAKLLYGGDSDRGADIPALIRDGALVVDVRTAREYSEGHFTGAVHIPYDEIGQRIGPIEKSRPIIVYCHSGGRSAVAKRTLEQSGFNRIIDAGSLHHMRKLVGD